MLSRATLPEEFFDITSAMLLVQPEPQYLHGMLLKMALSAQLDVSSAIGLAGREVTGVGAPYPGPEVDRFQLSDPIMSEALTVVPELGKGPGHTIRINRPKYANTSYTQATREILVGSTISTTPIDVSSEQVSITVRKFGGPYDSTNSRVAPIAVDKLEASMGVHNLVNVIGRHLKRDCDRSLDGISVALFDSVASGNIIRAPGSTTDNDSTVAGDQPFDIDMFFRAEEALDTANIPYFANGRRVAVLHPRQIRQLKGDSQFAKYAKFHSDINPLLAPAFEAQLGKTDIFKSNTLTTSTNNNSVVMYYGQMFGPGMVGCGMSRVPEVVASTADNYGESALVVWLMYAGFTVLDNRFGARMVTS